MTINLWKEFDIMMNDGVRLFELLDNNDKLFGYKYKTSSAKASAEDEAADDSVQNDQEPEPTWRWKEVSKWETSSDTNMKSKSLPLYKASYEESNGDKQGVRLLELAVPGVAREDLVIKRTFSKGQAVITIDNTSEKCFTRKFSFSWTVPDGYKFKQAKLELGLLTIRCVKVPAAKETLINIE